MEDVAEHSPPCTSYTLTQRNSFTAFVQSLISDDVGVGHTNDLPEMISMEIIKFVQKLFRCCPAVAIVHQYRDDLCFVDLKSGLQGYTPTLFPDFLVVLKSSVSKYASSLDIFIAAQFGT